MSERLPVPGWTLPGVMTTGRRPDLAAQLSACWRDGACCWPAMARSTSRWPWSWRAPGRRCWPWWSWRRRPDSGPCRALGRMAERARPVCWPYGAWRYDRRAETPRRGDSARMASVLAERRRKSQAGCGRKLAPWPRADQSDARAFEVDAVAHGLRLPCPPTRSCARSAAAHRFDPARGHLVTERDAEGRTTHRPRSMPWAIAAGLGGARGRGGRRRSSLALDAARSLGFLPSAPQAAAVARHPLRRPIPRFQAGSRQLFASPPLLRPPRPAGYADLPLRALEPGRNRGGEPRPARNPSAPLSATPAAAWAAARAAIAAPSSQPSRPNAAARR